MNYNAVDLFAGCGGLSEGLRQAGFNIIASVEINKDAARTYALNHTKTRIFNEDARCFNTKKIKELLNGQPLHLLAGCPPCQGFSSIRRRNKRKEVFDDRNNLILEYLRFIKELMPLTIMMENVPAIRNYSLFQEVYDELKLLGYNPKYYVVNVANYGVPQRRKRFIMVGSLIGDIDIAPANNRTVTVRNQIGGLESVDVTTDNVHKVYATHTPKIQNLISFIPKNGGSRKDLPEKYVLDCHKKQGVGFYDVYGRLKWDDVSSTITGGCLNPSKGRFLHPEENRCITAREAALLQTFPRNYIFPSNISKTALALLIGNALPPEFCRIQGENIYKHLSEHYKSATISLKRGLYD